MKRWTTYDETFYSDRIHKTASVNIEVLDDNVGKHNKLMFQATMKVIDLLATTRIKGSDVTLFLYSTWRDEFENSNAQRLG